MTKITQIPAVFPVTYGESMNVVLIVLSVIAVALLIAGHVLQSLSFLNWMGTLLLVGVVMAYLMKNPPGRPQV